MSDEPGHKAMLYFLEVLMNSAGPLTISQLAGRFGSATFSADMRTAAGGNEAGLKTFLLKYPSLFTLRGNMVSLCDGKDDDESSNSGGTSGGGVAGDAGTTMGGGSRRSLPDVSMEMDAVQFFQGQLARREERWVPVKSLAGHLSQTTPEIRAIVGPQLDFRKWLLRHVHIFEVQGELVALREGLAAVSTPTMGRRITFDLPTEDEYDGGAMAPPKTPPAQRRAGNKNGTLPLHRSHSFGDRNQLLNPGGTPPAGAPPRGGGGAPRDAPVTMTANEYKAVMWVKETLERRGATEVATLLGLLAQAPEGVRTTAGGSRGVLEAFLRKSAAIFSLGADQDIVDLVKNAKLSVIITGSRPNPPPAAPAGPPGIIAPVAAEAGRIVHEGKGKIFHVAKLWGIIDLGEHEHVFFDRSIMRQAMDDLQKHFETGETLCFSAVPAHKSSRAKWKAMHVWREGDKGEGGLEVPEGGATAVTDRLGRTQSDCSIETEMNEFLPRPPDPSSPALSPPPAAAPANPVQSFGDAKLSGAGAVPIWNFRADEERNKGGAKVCVVPESYQMSASVLSDLRFIPEFSPAQLYGSDSNGAVALPSGGLGVKGGVGAPPGGGGGGGRPREKTFATVACQTVSTGDIIATQLYQDS